MIIMSKQGKYFKLKNYERKINAPFMIYPYFESIVKPEEMERKIQKSLMLTNINSILLAVATINQYMLMICLVTFLKHTW